MHDVFTINDQQAGLRQINQRISMDQRHCPQGGSSISPPDDSRAAEHKHRQNDQQAPNSQLFHIRLPDGQALQ